METLKIENFMNIRNVKNPAYGPQGKMLNFISDASGIPQIWEIHSEGGNPNQVLETAERIMFVSFIQGTGKRIFGMDEGVNEKQQLFLLTETGEVIRLTDSPEHIHKYGGVSPDGKWISWASNRRHNTYFDIYIQSLESFEVKMVFQGDGHFSPLQWHPEGNSLLIEQVNTNLDNDLGLLDLSGGTVQWLTKHEGEAAFASPAFSSDGKMIYMLSNRDREFMNLARLNLETLETKWLVEKEWDLEELKLSTDKKKIAFSINEGGVSKGALLDFESNEVTEWESPAGVITDFSFSPDNSRLAFILNGPQHPSDIWELDLRSRKAKRATFISHDPLVEEKLCAPELISFASFDGLEIPAFYYKPKKADGKLPVVVYVHGGPESQIRAVFNPFLQFFLDNGFAVCTPNVRGSTGYGKSFTHLDDVRKRMDSVRDLVHLVDWLKTEGGADEDQISIMGRSYGGFMVLAAITHYPDIWSSAIDIVGISSFRTFLQNTSPWRRKMREAEYGSIENDGAFFDEIDPLHKTDRIQCPLLVLHGANDPRVPIEETEQIVEDLKNRKHPVEFIRFEDEGHFFVKRENNIKAYTASWDFLKEYSGRIKH
ncbi:S9 family peptidase [Bacillus infantis]|uniref:S9 family peptidase n=1 Tax=Bacillus infantis TaxID=324767 RepID=UPI002FBEFD81